MYASLIFHSIQAPNLILLFTRFDFFNFDWYLSTNNLSSISFPVTSNTATNRIQFLKLITSLFTKRTDSHNFSLK